MRRPDFEHLNLPTWMDAFLDELDSEIQATLAENSPTYLEIKDEINKLLEKYPFISLIIDRDTITEPLTLSVSEVKALSNLIALENDRDYIERIELYLAGFRHAAQFFSLIGIL